MATKPAGFGLNPSVADEQAVPFYWETQEEADARLASVGSQQNGRVQQRAKLLQIASAEGNISDLFSDDQLTRLGAQVVEDYERDCGDRAEWQEIAEKALKQAAQEIEDISDDTPEYRLNNVNFPILAVAVMQFNARAYPAICKPGNMVNVKVIGSDKGRPLIGQDGQQMVSFGGEPLDASTAMVRVQEAMEIAEQSGQDPAQLPPPEPAWQIPPGAKGKRAARVSDYLNVYLEYRMDGWEEDTDNLLTQMAIVGCGFRKLWWSNGKQYSAYVPALDLIVPNSAKCLKTTPRITERMPDVYPYQLRQRMFRGEYRMVELPDSSDNGDREAPRLLLEHHCLYDLDGDGLDEPYIVTVDHETAQVLKVEANFGPDQIRLDATGNVFEIEKNRFYIMYPFLPDPKGGFYAIGFGHLLNPLSKIIDRTLNQMFDAGEAQIAGGGFYASGLRLQGNGQTNTLRWRPGEYKAVNVSGATLREAFYERTFPGVSPIMFQLLELILGAAKEIASIKDVVTGEASNQGQVGTTLALIEQGLAVFTAIYKRVYRSLGEEFGLIYDNLSRYGGEEVAADYDSVLDDPMADFAKDFSERDMDIKPVADPSSVTKMQRTAKAQLLFQTGAGDPNVDQRALKKRIWEAADIEDIDSLLPAPDPNAPPPPEAVKLMSEAKKNDAQTTLYQAQAAEIGFNMGKATGAGAATEESI